MLTGKFSLPTPFFGIWTLFSPPASVLTHQELADNLNVTLLDSPLPLPLTCDLPVSSERTSSRVLGYDIARALAMLSMVVDHTAQFFGPRTPSPAGNFLLEVLDGRASALFVLLAGVGISLLTRRQEPAALRQTLLRRGLFLLVLGHLNLLLWQGDILRVFGVGLIVAAFLFRRSTRQLVLISVAIITAFPLLMSVFDFDAHWDWSTAIYRDLWTPTGILRNLLFDGFRPAIPWVGLLIFGMALGRLDVTRRSNRAQLLAFSLALLVSIEIAARVLAALLAAPRGPLTPDTADTWMGLHSVPPLPPFMLSVIASAVAIVGLSLLLGLRLPSARLTQALVNTGQMALSVYVFHILLGAALLHRFGRHPFRSTTAAVLAGLLFFLLLTLAISAWKRRFKQGPMEYLLRLVG